jgi:hypothetical protein
LSGNVLPTFVAQLFGMANGIVHQLEASSSVWHTGISDHGFKRATPGKKVVPSDATDIVRLVKEFPKTLGCIHTEFSL